MTTATLPDRDTKDDSPVALTNGSWQPTGHGTVVWVPDESVLGLLLRRRTS